MARDRHARRPSLGVGEDRLDPATGPPALVLDGGQRQSLVTVRALGRAGIQTVVAGSAGVPTPAFGSRWCTRHVTFPDAEDDADLLVDRVTDLCASMDRPVIITCHDGAIEALRARRSDVEQVASLALAPEDALSVAVDKDATLAAGQRVGIEAPRGRTVNDPSSAADAIADIGLPIVIKPTVSWVKRGTGGWRATPTVALTADAALAAAGRLIGGGVAALMQPWLSGSRDAVGVFLADGVIWAKFAVRSHRMYPLLGGDSVIRETIAMPADIGPMAEALVRELSLEGYSEVEFRRDQAGRPYLMEINPRLNAGVEVAVRAGVNVPLLLYEWAAGQPLKPQLRYRTAQRMRWLSGDVKWLVQALLHPEHPDAPIRVEALRSFLAGFRGGTNYDYLDRKDTAPAFLQLARSLRTAPRRLKARMSS